jgi:hypothetical protein
MTGFVSQIEAKIKAHGVCLRYLEQYLEGPPKELIKGCFFSDPTQGYNDAKKLLTEKYGDPYIISNAYIKKATDWPNIKSGDNAALERFSTFLVQCCSAMASLSYLSVLDHPHNIQTLVTKLPLALQDRWRKQAYKLREANNGAIPGFKTFADFVQGEVKVAMDPVFSREALSKMQPFINNRTRNTAYGS